MSNYLRNFKYISVRESKGKELIEELKLDNYVDVVCDPTLLLNFNEWRNLYNNKSEVLMDKDSYIFCYFVGGMKVHYENIKQIAIQLNKKIVTISLNNQDNDFSDCIYVDGGPYEFLYLIDNARYICTDSFHAIALSLTFNKMFTVFDRNFTFGKPQNSRIVEILKRYNMKDCLFSESKVLINDNLDYNRVNELIDDDREKSIQILKKYLEI